MWPGPRAIHEKRLNAPEVALGAGVRDVGLGLLLGLAPWQFDVLATMLHAAHLNRLFGAGGHTISMFRLRPAPGSLFVPPHPLSDDEFLRCVAIMRLAVPHAGVVIVTTREPSGLWRDACSSGVSQVFTGSVGSAYETWSEKPGPDWHPLPAGRRHPSGRSGALPYGRGRAPALVLYRLSPSGPQRCGLHQHGARVRHAQPVQPQLHRLF